jgi:tetratricopeptide (TPR) repeat protein
MSDRSSPRPGGILGPIRDFLHRNWALILIPPAMCLLAAGVTRQVLRAREGSGAVRSEQSYRAAMKAAQEGRLDEARTQMAAAEAAAPADANAHRELSHGFYKLGDEPRALDHLEQTLVLQSRQAAGDEPKRQVGPAAWMGIVRANQRLGRPEVAERIIRTEVLPRWPDPPDAYYVLGLMRLERDTTAESAREAMVLLGKALEVKPDHPDARKALGDCQVRLGKPAEAESAYRAVLAREPGHPGAIRELVAVLRSRGQADEARRLMTRLQELDQRQARLRHLETKLSLETGTLPELREVGELYLQLDRAKDAEPVLLKYTKQEPTDPQGHRALAEVYRRTDRAREAELARELAGALKPQRGGP